MSSASKPPDDDALERRRVPFEREVSLKFRQFRGFLTEYSGNISSGGMFIRTDKPKPPGSAFDFEILLEDGFTLIQGVGEVVWTRQRPGGHGRPTGMGVRFLGLTPESQELIRRIVQEHVAGGGTPFDPDQPPEPEPPLQSPPAIPPDPPPQEKTATPTAAASTPPPAAPAAKTPTPEHPPRAAPVSAAPPTETPAIPEPEPRRPPPPRRRPPRRARHAAFRTSPWRRWALLLAASVGLFLAAAGAMYGWLSWSLGATPPPVGAPSLLGSANEPPPESSAANFEPAASASTAGDENGDEPPIASPAEPPSGTVQPAAGGGVAAAVRASEPQPPATLSRVTAITWQPEPGGLAVTLQGDGRFEAQRYNRLRLEASPRELVRVLGITRAFPRTQIPVGTPEVQQIRIGYHRKPGDNQLHVVLDLTSPQVRLERLEPVGDRLILHLARP